ncbi:WRKY transcription factor 55 [Impatiens glandulifera]|uniref:WRKY transcription factor 55 n=1 Tax=Impatiens glandulifera TaxID=253017 RepID=UPI001FB13191|nr:WRKY transcription factor 55 [Impatiens glandulifera]
MEVISSIVLHGCKIARELEMSLPNIILTNQHPSLQLINSCQDIIRVFTTARDHLLASQPSTSYVAMYTHHHAGILPLPPPPQQPPLMDQGNNINLIGEDSCPMLDVPNSSRATGSSLQRTRTRKSDGDRVTVMVPAPQFGNTEIPPEDGYTWRKYGQKEIYGSRFPRSYYRCTHQKLYNCLAKKQVQRTDSNPLMYEVIYRTQHTCHMSSTAPTPATASSSDPPAPPHVPVESQPASWLSMDINRPSGGEGPSTFVMCPNPNIGSELGLGFVVGPTDSTTTTTTTTTATTTTVCPTIRYPREVDTMDYYQGLVDLADGMINSGESTGASNNMDLIFPSIDHDNKWEARDKK